MPELPEVETIARGLAPQLTRRRVTGVDVLWGGALVPPAGPAKSRVNAAPEAFAQDAQRFKERLTGRVFTATRRRGKLLIVDMDEGMHIAVHLKMTGRLWVPPEGTPPDKYTHLAIRLDNGRELHFRDVRKFGYVLALTDQELAELPFLKSLGPEPLEMGPDDFVAAVSKKRAAIKAVLLDQTVIAGIGNIYADEALFRAKIHPRAIAAQIIPTKLRKLFREVQAVLQQGINENGASFRDYVNASGDAGSFQNSFQVYGRGGQPCPKCGQAFEVTTVAGRTSTYCPGCQKP